MKRIAALWALALVLSPVHPSLASERSCKAVYEDCVKWCYAQRSGPERFHCKGMCRSEFNTAQETGVFHREDGNSEACGAGANIVLRVRDLLINVATTAD